MMPKLSNAPSEPQVDFIEPKDMGPRIWGMETLLAVVPGKFSLKRLAMRAGCKGGLQYHHKKDECGYMLSGEMIVRYDKGGLIAERILREGDVFHFPPGAVHQEEAVTDCVILEVSTPFANDRVRVEEKYGLPKGEGLQSTKINEVVDLI
jgi:mannose-6-phosphate isomerase